MRLGLCALSTLVIITSGCDSIAGNDGPVCAAIQLQSTSLNPRVGETAHIGATAVDAAGRPVPGVVIKFASGSPAIATADLNTGAVVGVSPGAVIISAAATCGPNHGLVTAELRMTIRPQLVRLAINRTGTGNGSVVNTPGGTEFDAGTSVTLTATAAQGSVFDGWTGACAAFGRATTCTVSMAAPGPVTVGASFTLGETLVTTPAISGSFGTLTGSTGCRWSIPFTSTLNLSMTNQSGVLSGSITVSPQVTFAPAGVSCTVTPFSHQFNGTATQTGTSVSASANSTTTTNWRVSVNGTRGSDRVTATVVFNGVMRETGTGGTIDTPVSATVNNVSFVRQ